MNMTQYEAPTFEYGKQRLKVRTDLHNPLGHIAVQSNIYATDHFVHDFSMWNYFIHLEKHSNCIFHVNYFDFKQTCLVKSNHAKYIEI